MSEQKLIDELAALSQKMLWGSLGAAAARATSMCRQSCMRKWQQGSRPVGAIANWASKSPKLMRGSWG